MVKDAEKLLFEESLDLAEIYDLVAFVLITIDDFANAFSVSGCLSMYICTSALLIVCLYV